MKNDNKLKYDSLRKEKMELTLKLDFKKISGEAHHDSTKEMKKRIKQIDDLLKKMDVEKEKRNM